MGKKGSKYFRQASLTKEELKAIEVAFDIRIGHSTGVKSDQLADKWRDYMTEPILRLWINYIFPSNNLDWKRFAYLHQGQVSHFLEERAQAVVRVILNIPKEDPTEPVDIQKVIMYFREIVASYLRSLASYKNDDFIKWLIIAATTSGSSLNDVINYLSSDLKNNDLHDSVLSKDIEDWLRTKRSVSDILTGFIKIAYGMVDNSIVVGVIPTPFSKFPTILDISQIIFLCSHLTKNCTKNWKLKFHNQAHGSNFTLLSKTVIGVGPTILIIKDHGNHVFGCFASQSWKQSSQFYGDHRCFLFQLKPVIRLFEPSGVNMNFMFHNATQHIYPKGFGMGGRVHFFGLWVDGDFGHGECTDFCSTFTNYVRPSVSTSFTFTHIEVWAVAPFENEDTDIINHPSYNSVVEADPFARALIEYGGKGTTLQSIHI